MIERSGCLISTKILKVMLLQNNRYTSLVKEKIFVLFGVTSDFSPSKILQAWM